MTYQWSPWGSQPAEVGLGPGSTEVVSASEGGVVVVKVIEVSRGPSQCLVMLL